MSPPSNPEDSDPDPEKIDYQVNVRSFWERDIPVNVIFQSIQFYELHGPNRMPVAAMNEEQKTKADTYALNRGLPSYRLSITAIPYHKKLAKNSRCGTSAESRTEWMAVEKILTSFDEAGYKGLTVDLLYHYAPTPTGAPITVAPTSSQNQIRRSRTAGNAIVGRIGTTTIAHLEARDLSNSENPDEAGKEALREKWECKDTRCSNHPYYCWVDEGTHWPLNLTEINMWWAAINRGPAGRVTDERPPVSMTTAWMANRKKKELADKRRERATATPFGGPPPTGCHRGYGGHGCGHGHSCSPQLPQLPPQIQLQNFPTHQMKQELLNREHLERAQLTPRGFSETPVPPPRNSSPVEGLMTDFINWMKRKRPEYAADFDEAKHTLMDMGYTTEVI